MKNRINNPIHVAIQGTLIGKIWMPACYCTKPFSMVVTTERGRFTDHSLSITEAIERVLNDGDFQSCSIVEATVIFSFWSKDRKITRYLDISKSKAIKHCLAGKKELKQYEKIEYAS